MVIITFCGVLMNFFGGGRYVDSNGYIRDSGYWRYSVTTDSHQWHEGDIIGTPGEALILAFVSAMGAFIGTLMVLYFIAWAVKVIAARVRRLSRGTQKWLIIISIIVPLLLGLISTVYGLIKGYRDAFLGLVILPAPAFLVFWAITGIILWIRGDDADENTPYEDSRLTPNEEKIAH